MAELDVVLTRLDALDKQLSDQWQAVNGRLDDLGQRITAVETRLTSAEHRMASNVTVNVWGATITGLMTTAIAVMKLWT
jgi:hypothetical protein